MSKLRVQLFGRFSVFAGDHLVENVSGAKVQELFAYLLIHSNRPHSREALASLLWGGCSTAQSKKYLRQALWQLHSTLGCKSGASKNRVLQIEPEWVGVNPQADVRVDVVEFESAARILTSNGALQLRPSAAETLTRAVELYCGDLLEGWFQDWCLYERERLQNTYLAVLERLMKHCETGGEYDRGLLYGGLILRYDRACECAHQQMMRLHYLAGDRAAALRQYQRCAAALNEELGVEPSDRTTALHEQIRAGRLGSETRTSSRFFGEAGVPQLANALERLQQLVNLLTRVQHEVRNEIMVVERALRPHSV